MLIPGTMPVMFIAITPKKKTPISGAYCRPRFSPNIGMEIESRINRAHASISCWKRVGTIFALIAPAANRAQISTAAMMRASVRRLTTVPCSGPNSDGGKKSVTPGLWGWLRSAGIAVRAIRRTRPAVTIQYQSGRLRRLGSAERDVTCVDTWVVDIAEDGLLSIRMHCATG